MLIFGDHDLDGSVGGSSRWPNHRLFPSGGIEPALPKLPAQPRGEFAGDAWGPTAIFPFNSDDPDYFLLIIGCRPASPSCECLSYLSVVSACPICR
jgi:hypothetical protein